MAVGCARAGRSRSPTAPGAANLVYAALSVAILLAIAGVVFEWQRERSQAPRA